MPTPSPQMRFRAVSMEIVRHSGEGRPDMFIVADDGTTIAIECENGALSQLQEDVLQISGEPEENIPGNRGPDGSTGGERLSQTLTDDIIKHIEAQRENVEGRRIFKDLFDNSEAGIIDYDFSALFRLLQSLKRAGVRNLRTYLAEAQDRAQTLVDAVCINNINAVAMRMLGVTSLQDHITPPTNITDVAEAIFLEETSMRRSEYVAFQGTLIPIVYSLRVPGTEEEARRVPIVMIDLSDIKLAEAARQATLAKSKFLSSMSHEIRTPLNGVIGNLELLALTNLDDEQLELIDDADKAAKALLGLVGNILDFSKIEAGKLTTEIGDINPAVLVQEAVDVLQSVSRQKRIFITAAFGPDVPSLVRGDAMRVRQILLNLIGNAVKFTERGGVQVSLTVSNWDNQSCELRFEVNDSGRGFERGMEARLFEPFTQDRAAADGAEGTGLGLSICHSLVNVFGGTIGCEGVPEEGATFWFTMPVTVVRRAAPVPRLDLSGLRVMVSGRGTDGAKSIAEYFKDRGAEVVVETHRTALVFALEQGSARPGIDVAVLVPDGRDDDSEIARRLREKHIVPLLYGVDQSPRIWLRPGFAAAIPCDASADYLDRNIRLLVGHAQAGDRMAAQQAALVSAFSPDVQGAHVLVLEDRLVNQTVIQKQLKKLGVSCTLVANGVKGLEAIDRQRFDLILCDCSMPELNGYDFTRALRKRESADGNRRRVPVIALTANAFSEDADRCFEAGMDAFISKPVTMDRLAATLVRWLSPPDVTIAAPDQPETAHEAELPVIDIEVLSEILGTDDAETLNEVLAEFMATIRGSLAEVEAALTSGRLDHIKATTHTAKGEARCAAATGLAELYAAIERRATDGDGGPSRRLASRVNVEMLRIEDFIRARLEAPVL